MILIVDIVIVTPFYISLGFFALLSGTLLPGFVLISSCVVAILGGIISLLIKKNIAAIVFLAGVPFAAYMLMNFLYS